MTDTETPNLPVKAQPKAELVAGNRVAPIVPRTVDEVARVAKAVIVAGLAPNSYDGRTSEETAAKVMIGIMKGAEVGFPPITALSTIAIINNRPCIWGDGAVALAQAHGQVEKVEAIYEGELTADGFTDTYTAVYRIWRRAQENPYEGRFSVADAKRAHLWQNPKRDPWMKYPKRMLMMRARAFALRDGFADCLSGLAIAEEVQDFPEAPKPVEASFLDDALPTIGVSVDNAQAEAITVAVDDDKPASYADAKAAADKGAVALGVWWKQNPDSHQELADWRSMLDAIANKADLASEAA